MKNCVVLLHHIIKNWNDEEARELLTKVLDNQGLAYDIFFHDNDKALNTLNDIIVDDDTLEEEMESSESDGPLYRDEYLVGKFIKEIISTDNIYKDYLISICTGLMICSGVYQLPSSKASIVQAQIRGSFFFFDTKLLLRFIECSGEAAISATKELVKLIQDAGGVVCYYQHTKEEIEYAFDETIRKLRLNLPVLDNEMRLFISKTKTPWQYCELKDQVLFKNYQQRTFLKNPQTIIQNRKCLNMVLTFLHLDNICIKTYYNNISFLINQYILWLYISMPHMLIMCKTKS